MNAELKAEAAVQGKRFLGATKAMMDALEWAEGLSSHHLDCFKHNFDQFITQMRDEAFTKEQEIKRPMRRHDWGKSLPGLHPNGRREVSAKLTNHQKFRLEMLDRGYGISAAQSGWKRKDFREMMDLVERGLIRITPPNAWNKAGAFVKIDKPATQRTEERGI